MSVTNEGIKMSDDKAVEAGDVVMEGDAIAPGEQPPPAYGSGMGVTNPAPPSYTQGNNDFPPDYDTLYGKLKQTKTQSSGTFDFGKKLVVLLLSTIGCTIIIGLVLAIPISMIVMGSVYLHDCPAERYIPIYLVVGGVFGVIKNMMGVGHRVKDRDEDPEEQSKTNPVDATLNCFLFAWFIAGNVWIYRTRFDYQSHNKTLTVPPFCDETLYQYAFWLTTSTYIFIGAMCCCVCCAGVAAAAAGD